METVNILTSKHKMREIMLNKLNKLKEVDRAKKSLLIKEKLFETSEFKKAKIILFYASLTKEVDTDIMIKDAQEQGKTIALPVVEEGEKKIIPYLVSDFDSRFVIGAYGIREPDKEFSEPISIDALDLVIVPGIAFDREGNRLGRGKGYYDRFLKILPKHVLTIGLAFDFQIVCNLPHSSVDSPVNKIIFS
jgi:5-formyltetrahydrofolate cyclo-ligase